MASQPIDNSFVPIRKVTGKPKLSLVVSPAVAEKVLQIADQIRPDGRAENLSRPYFKAPWLKEYKAPNWPKGVSGNPQGRRIQGAKPFRKLAQAYKEIAEQIDPDTGLSFGHLVALAQFHNAIEEGSATSAKEIREAMEGKLLSDASAGDLVGEGVASVRAKLFQKLVYAETSISVEIVPVRPITGKKVLDE